MQFGEYTKKRGHFMKVNTSYCGLCSHAHSRFTCEDCGYAINTEGPNSAEECMDDAREHMRVCHPAHGPEEESIAVRGSEFFKN